VAKEIRKERKKDGKVREYRRIEDKNIVPSA